MNIKLNFVLTNMSKEIGQPTLEDPMILLSGQATDLGIDVCANGGMGINAKQGEGAWIARSDYINLIFDGFDEDMMIPQMLWAKSKGARIVAIATEEPGKFGFNHGTPTGLWGIRQKNFQLAVKAGCFEGVLYFVPQGGPWYKNIHPNSAHVETGYSRSLDNPSTLDKVFSFCFCGGMGEYRNNILKAVDRQLEGKHLIARQRPDVLALPPRAQRDEILRRSKISLQIKPHGISRIISGSRCAWSLLNGVPVVSQYIKSEGSEWPLVFAGAMADDRHSFPEFAVSYLPHYQNLYMRQREQFIRIMSPERCLLKALRELGIMSRPIGARRVLVS